LEALVDHKAITLLGWWGPTYRDGLEFYIELDVPNKVRMKRHIFIPTSALYAGREDEARVVLGAIGKGLREVGIGAQTFADGRPWPKEEPLE
jgi:hypothetical protein